MLANRVRRTCSSAGHDRFRTGHCGAWLEIRWGAVAGDGIAKRSKVVGIDLVEVAREYAPVGTTNILAAQMLLDLIGRVLHHR